MDQDWSLYLTLRGTMFQLKTLRLVEKGDSKEEASYNSYIDYYQQLDKQKTSTHHNIEELNKTLKKKPLRVYNQGFRNK